MPLIVQEPAGNTPHGPKTNAREAQPSCLNQYGIAMDCKRLHTTAFFSLLLIFTLFTSLLKAQNIEFNHLTPDEGLSQISANSLYADRDGVIWIATRVGLNSYDGNSIRVYTNKTGDANSLFCNNVTHLTGDGDRKLFLLCAEGIARLDLQTRQFKTLKYGNTIGAICYYGRLYFSERNEIHRLLDETGRSKACVRLPKGQYVTSLTIDTRGRMWIGTRENGVYCYAGNRLTHPITEGYITQIYEDRGGKLWIGSWNNGFWTIDNQGHINNIRKGKLLVSNFVRTFCEDNSGKMWIGTYLGLVRYDPRTGQSRTFIPDGREDGLTNASIWSIIKDRQGTLWLGTYFGGVNYFNPEYEIFTQYRFKGENAAGLSSQIVGRMTEDDKGNLWICTEGGGLNIFSPRSQAFSVYKYPDAKPSHNNLKSIYFDKLRRTMWVGTHLGGLDRIALSTGKLRNYRHKAGDRQSLPSDIVRDIKPYRGQLVIATQEGVVMMDPEKETFTPLLAKENLRMVQGLCIDRKDRLWIATEARGVYCYAFSTKKFRHYRHLPSEGSISCNNINSIMTDREGRIWLSTANDGIDLYDEQHDRFINYGRKDGLIGACVYAIEPSSLNANELLLITNQGFSVFNIKSKNFRNYNKENGFPLATINENALYVARDGTVYLGGVRGMVAFREQDLYKKSRPYKVGFCGLYINGRQILPGDDSRILTHALRYTSEIELGYDRSVLGVEYYTSNYIKANALPLEYRLVGSSEQWFPIHAGQKKLDFFNLPPGRYTLELRSVGTKVPEARLGIRILPPWYRSWWAYVLYFCLTAIAVMWLVRGYRKRIRLAESLKYEKIHARNIEKRNQSKIRFFTNVSHEIRTPLTVIIGLAESLLHSRKFTNDIYNQLLGIYRNSSQLRELISELLDFKKHEKANPKISVHEGKWSPFVFDVCSLFKEYAACLDINLTFKSETDVTVWFDNRQMRKVVNNLVSNALKHTPQGGSITVTTESDETYARLRVTDTGNGIAPDDLSHVFDRFYQGHEIESLAEMGTGIGLNLTQDIIRQHHGKLTVTSVVGQGTTFTVELPLGKSHFSADQIAVAPMAETAENTAEEPKKQSQMPLPAPQNNTDDTPTPATFDATALVVEDNDDIRQLLVTLLSPYYRTLTAVDGLEGLEKIKDEMPDIIISDVLMPNMSGIEMCKAIKQDFAICHIPVVLLTARTAAEQALEGLKIGADDYITKPFNNEFLISRCNNLVNSRRLLQHKFGEHPHTEANMLASNPLDKEMLDRAMKIIDKHYMNSDFSVDVFAREMGLSRTSLFTKWKTLTGQTPNEFIMRIRLRKAAKMLREKPHMSIAEISYSNGFSSPRYFCKCFKDRYQQQPSTYRNGEGT